MELLNYLVILLRKHQTIVHKVKWPHHFTFAQAMSKGSNFSMSLLTFIICSFLDYSHSSECEGLPLWV